MSNKADEELLAPPPYDGAPPPNKRWNNIWKYTHTSLYVLVGVHTFLALCLTIAAFARAMSDCAINHNLDCRIPECLCGTAQQLSGCRNYSNPRDAGCSAQRYRAFVDSGGNAYTWRLAMWAFYLMALIIPITIVTAVRAYLGYRTTTRRPLERFGFDRGCVRLFYGMILFSYVAMFMVIVLIFFIGTVLACMLPMPNSLFLLIAMLIISEYVGVAWLVAIDDLHLPERPSVYSGLKRSANDRLVRT
jgi:hypothetical protein